MKRFTSAEIRNFISKSNFDGQVISKEDLSWPKISIITPSYNQARFLERTILSVLNQNYPNLEYIIIDGGSTDDSVEIIKRYEKYLAYWASEKDNGQSDAIRKGFARSTGKILAYLNSDDVYLPGTLVRVAHVFQDNRDVKVVYGNKYLTDEKDEIIGERRLTPYIPFISKLGLLYGGFGIYQPASFWATELYYAVGEIDASFEHCMDNDLFNRFALAGAKFKFIREYLAGSRIHQLSKTSNLQHIAKKEIKIIKNKYCKYDSKLFDLCYLTFIRIIRTMIHLVQGDGVYLFKRKFASDMAWIS